MATPWVRRAVFAAALGSAVPALAADRHYTFGYDQPHTTGFGVAGDIFAAKLSELSHGSMAVDQFPGAQLGQEPQMLQKLRTGDIDFAIISSANSATLSPESGVMSIHFIFKTEDQLIHAIAEPKLIAAVREMFDATVKDAHVLALATLGLRDMYGKHEVRSRRRSQGLQGAGAGHTDGGHAVPRLWRADRAHAVRQRLHLVADRRGRSMPRTA